MQSRKGRTELSVMEAVDNLSHMAELDLTVPGEKVEARGLTDEQMTERMNTLSWHDPEYDGYNRERIKETFQALLKYMRDLYERDKGHLREEEVQRGIQAMMLLAIEAAHKIDHYTGILQGEKAVDLKEFKELQQFYQTKVVQRFNILPEVEEKWHEEWGPGVVDVQSEGPLKDLEAIRRDRDYELLLLRQADGTAFFNRPLLHHMRLVGQFDQLMSDPTMEDPFLRILMITDRDAQASAREILLAAKPHIDLFYKQALKFKRVSFVASLSKAMMALMMAADTRRLVQNATGKHCLNYFHDFHYYLRSALNSPEYLKMAASPSLQTEEFLDAVYALSHAICSAFFFKTGSRHEMIAFIRGLIEKGARGIATQSQTASPIALWNNLRDCDESIRHLLKLQPAGPLLKSINVFKEGEELSGFDPISSENHPSQLYTFFGGKIHVSCMRIPSPTQQSHVHKADVVQEFYGFLRTLKGRRHLLVNLQDRTSWLEHARCFALEEIAKSSEFQHCFSVATLPRNTEFYFQSGSYIEWDDAQEFMKQFKEQILSKEECGFYFPKEFHSRELEQFVPEALSMIHRIFFGGKERLVHKNRLDFIEIFYLMLTLKLIDLCAPDSISFTCKDGIDAGAALAAGLYALLRMANGIPEWSKQEKEFLLWMLYSPSLSVRERAIDPVRFNRIASALALVAAELEANARQTLEACSSLFNTPFFKGLKVQEFRTP
jgi:hypothetical protein